MSTPSRPPSFELVPVRDEAGEAWLLVRIRPEHRVIRRFDDRETADLVMRAMQALELAPGEESPG
jgi:hypothetical protein